MPDPALFPFIDSVIRLIAVLALCLAPFLVPLPPMRHIDRRWRLLRKRWIPRREPVSSP